MKIDKARLTAFANGELKGAEAAEIEAALRKDPEAAAFVEQQRALAKRLRADLGGEPLPSGGGSERILREIKRRQGNKPSEKQVWLQGAAVVGVVVLLLALVPLQKKFGGGLSNMFGMGPGLNHATDHTVDDGDHPSIETDAHRGPPPKEDPHAIERDVEALGGRRVVRESVPGCRFSLPGATDIDRMPKESLAGGFHRIFLLTESGTELGVSVGTNPQPLVREEGVVELDKDGAFTYFRRVPDELGRIFYKVPADSHVPYCWVRVVLDGKLTDAARKLAGDPLEKIARKIAESMDLR
jgi:hypothetical protein